MSPGTNKSFYTFCFRYLATGDSLHTIAHSYRVGISTVGSIVKEVCLAICNVMGPIYLPEPTPETWAHAANVFQEKWQFPNCCGAIDGKHVTIQCPPKTGSNYYCYLKKFSIVLMAIADADYKFICVDIGGYGKNSDGGILDHSVMGRRFENKTMKLPPPKCLPGQNSPSPHVLIGDEAFALKPYMMRPFPYRISRGDEEKENFNYRLSRARRVVENAFGILAKKWRIYRSPIEMKVETTKCLVLATVILHNYLRTKNLPDETMIGPDSEVGAFDLLERDTRRSTNEAFEMRNNFVRYFRDNRI